MDLYLHIGVVKTGSSYLQYLMANYRNELQKKGIYFPVDNKYESKMINGELTPGNAFELYKNIRDRNIEDAKKYLKMRILEANNIGASKILLSSEQISNVLNGERLSILDKIIYELDFTNYNIFVFLRDPVEHAISLYKHSNRTGKNNDYENWLKENYNIYKYIYTIVNNTTYSYNLTLKKFTKDSDKIIKDYFNEWLVINLSENIKNKRVNESITLSEMHFLQKLYASGNGTLAHLLSENIFKLNKKNKYSDVKIHNNYEIVTRNIINTDKKINTYINKINQYLDDNNKLILNVNIDNNNNDIKRNGYYSEYQLHEISKHITYIISPEGILKYYSRKYRKYIPNILFKIYNIFN